MLPIATIFELGLLAYSIYNFAMAWVALLGMLGWIALLILTGVFKTHPRHTQPRWPVAGWPPEQTRYDHNNMPYLVDRYGVRVPDDVAYAIAAEAEREAEKVRQANWRSRIR